MLKGHGSKFSHKKEEAIIALLTHRTIEEAARATGISVQTLYRWLRLPEFQRAYREARGAAFSQANGRLQQASTAAVSTLLKVMVDPASPAPSRVRAAGIVLEQARQSFEYEDVDLRLKALEQAAADNAAKSYGEK